MQKILAWYMQNLARALVLLLFAATLFFSGCGKKRKNIFSFPSESEKKDALNTFTLPSVKGLFVEKNLQGVILRWQPVLDRYTKDDDISLSGYNVYRFFKGSFIPRTPQYFVNASECFCSCSQKGPFQKSNYFVVAVFTVRGKLVEGPASKIVVS